jgi:Domain of unknown function (DUF4388)
MALKGTLKDFGIADIFQLIGHQTKTGVLHLVAKDETVHIAFLNGNIVRADSTSRRNRDLLGSMLVNAQLLSPDQLEVSLDIQRRTLRRLGDILVERHYVSSDQLKEMFQLQVTETIYRLFGWKTGTYEFEQGAVEFEEGLIVPIRSESVLMEGFRRVDEWPSIHHVISSPQMTFEKLRPLPLDASEARSGGSSLSGLDEVFEGGSEEPKPRGGPHAVGAKERQAFQLATPGRTAQQIVDRSRMGEFETCKALVNLVNAGVLKAVPPVRTDRSQGDRLRERVVSSATRLGMTLLVLAVAALVVGLMEIQRSGASATEPTFLDRSGERLIASTERERIANALAVYRLEKGEFPEHLEDLATAGLLPRTDSRRPLSEAFYYRRASPQEYVLLLPLR